MDGVAFSMPYRNIWWQSLLVKQTCLSRVGSCSDITIGRIHFAMSSSQSDKGPFSYLKILWMHQVWSFKRVKTKIFDKILQLSMRLTKLQRNKMESSVTANHQTQDSAKVKVFVKCLLLFFWSIWQRMTQGDPKRLSQVICFWQAQKFQKVE